VENTYLDNNTIDINSNGNDEYNINQVFKDKDENESTEKDIDITDSMIKEEERVQLENQVEDEKEQEEFRRKVFIYLFDCFSENYLNIKLYLVGL